MRWTDEAIDQLYAAIGSNVKDARQRVGITQTDLGKRLQLTRSSIANIEAGRQRIMIHSIMQIADELDVPLAKLLTPPTDSTEGRVAEELKGQPETTQDFVISTFLQAQAAHEQEAREA